MTKPQAVGIDLGTTFSVVAFVDQHGRSEVLRNSEGDILTPSIVLFDDAEVVVGKEARAGLGVHPDRVAEWVKRDMGAPVYSRPIRGERLPPEVIQSCILRKLRTPIVKTLGPDSRIVITVPAYFDELRRKATADAGEMAGLALLDIVNEPTAAALAFGQSLGYLSPQGGANRPMNVLVYDLGGGTFDVTLLRLTPGEIRAIATDGDVQLGGHDWDMRLVDYAAQEFQKTFDLDPREDLVAFYRVLGSAIDAKHTLSARSRATIRVDYGGHSLEVPVDRQAFEDLTADLLERTAHTTRQLITTARMTWSDVSRVLLVGGATRMPMVERMLAWLTGHQPDRTVNPDEAVARGAALYAHYLLSKHLERSGGSKAPFEVVNVNAHSLGVEGIDPQTLRKTNVVLIPRNTPLPATATERFTTKQQDQRTIVIRILEGESSMPGECTTIGRTALRHLPPGLAKGWPVDVTFEYATNGRLAVRAVVPGTSRELSLQLERDRGLSRDHLARWRPAVDSLSGFDVFESMLGDILDDVPGELPGAPVAPEPSPPWQDSAPPDPPLDDPPAPLRDSPAPPDDELQLPVPPTAAPSRAAPPSAAPQPATPLLWIISVVGYILSALLGLAIGYLLVSWWWPDSDILKLLR